MPLLEIFKPKPRWLHNDPLVRLDAVRTLPADDQALLASLARTDVDTRVRRAAVKRLRDAPVLVDLVRDESDATVRSEAQEALLHLVAADHDVAVLADAVSELNDTKLIVATAKKARSEAVRRAALDRLSDMRSIAVVARDAEAAEQRLAALERLADPAQRAAVAQGSEHRDVALAALELIRDRGLLKSIARRAKVKAVSRRARALLAELETEPEALAPAERHARQASVCHMVEGLTHRHDWDAVAAELDRAEAEWEQLGPEHDAGLRERFDEARRLLHVALARVQEEQTAQSEAEAAHTAALETRRALCEQVEALAGPETLERLADLQRRWTETADESDEGRALQARFEAAVDACRARHAAGLGAVAREERRKELCAEAERIVEGEDLVQASKSWAGIERVWREVTSVSTRDELSERWGRARARIASRETEERETRAREASENVARIEAICTRGEALAANESASFRDLNAGLREVQAVLDQTGPLPSRRERDAYVERLDGLRRALYPRVQAMREDEDWKRWANVAVQEGLCQEIEALREVEDLDEAAKRLRDIDARWKLAREVPRERGAALWERFRQSRDVVWARLSEHLTRQAEQMAEALKKKEALCEQAESLAGSTDWARTAEALRKLQEEWKTLGPVHRAKGRAVWQRFRRANDQFFARHKAQREARAAEWAENLKKKEALCEQAESLAQSSEWEAAVAQIRKLQEEWKAIGPVRRNKSEAVWKRFRAAADELFDRYKRRDEIGAEQQSARRLELIQQVETLLADAGGDPSPEEIVRRALEIHEQWKQIPRPSNDAGREQVAQLDAAVAQIARAHAAAFAGTDLDPAHMRRRVERLCSRLEAIVAQCQPAAVGAGDAGADLAARLRNALAANAMGGEAERHARWLAAQEEVEEISGAWRHLGAIVTSTPDLEDRFRAAYDRFIALRPPSAPGRKKGRRRSGH